MPPCNCGGASQYRYEYTNPATGQTKTYDTEIEAKAARVRAGNQGAIRTVSK